MGIFGACKNLGKTGGIFRMDFVILKESSDRITVGSTFANVSHVVGVGVSLAAAIDWQPRS